MAAACVAAKPLPPGNAAYTADKGLEYRLGPGDKVRVTVFNDASLSGEFMVSNNGNIVLPLIGPVKAGGSTPAAFQAAVADQLLATGMVREPRVTVDVVSYRPYYILGEVENPGQYEYSVGLTITKAVATSGGFTYRADERVAYVTREGETAETAVPITAATWVGPGDTVRIAQRVF
jgi:polysaccharide export outer membrane protein